jgi:hypothetical protein
LLGTESDVSWDEDLDASVLEKQVSIQAWLAQGKERLTEICRVKLVKPLSAAKSRLRGVYWKTRIGGKPADRTARRHRKEEKLKKEKEEADKLNGRAPTLPKPSHKITDFFSKYRPESPSPPAIHEISITRN